MSPALVWLVNAAAGVAINALWQDALLVLGIWLLLRAWPQVNAVTRYAVWSVTLAAAAIVPVATTLPFVHSAAPPVRAAHADGLHAAARRVTSPSAAQPAASSGIAVSSQRAARPSLPPRLVFALPTAVAMAICCAWIALVLYSLARLAIGLLALERLKRDALPLPVEYRDAMKRWNEANKGSRGVRLCVTDDIDVPVAVGLFDAMVLIPRVLLDQLSQADVDQISLHELAHLRRADDWTNGVQRLLTALFAWNPAVLFVGRQLDLEREIACDDFVLSLTGTVRPYAQCLTKMAETTAWPRPTIAAPGVFATRKHISMRIERLLAAGRNVATSLAPGPAAAAVATVALLGLAIALVAPAPAAPQFVAPAAPQLAVPVTAAKAAAREHAAVRVAQAAPAATPAARASAAPSVVHIPGTHVHVAGQTIEVPAVKVHVPAIDVNVPSMNVPVPKLHDQMTRNGRSCSGCNEAGVNWAGRDLAGGTYFGTNFTSANLRGTNFSGGSFTGVIFRSANLRGANFRNARLYGINFRDAQLAGANFDGAELDGCDLRGADLTHVDLSKARMTGTKI
jgi:beta-lactamase regulating signal transducer with metallopeptidase domain